nr:immunoglobulin heavy chain junction region [Mus musculus]
CARDWSYGLDYW